MVNMAIPMVKEAPLKNIYAKANLPVARNEEA